MRAICIYVNRGKEYKYAADVICSELNKQGHQAVTEELFDYLDIKWMENATDTIKHLFHMLHMRFSSTAKELDILLRFARKHCTLALKSNLEEAPADVIIGTHPYAGRLMAELLSTIGMNSIPVLYYETGIFSVSREAVSENVSCFLIPTDAALRFAEKLNNKQIRRAPVISSSVSRLTAADTSDDGKLTVLVDQSREKINPSSLITAIAKAKLNLKFIIIRKDFRRYLQKAKPMTDIAYADPSDKEMLYSKADIVIGPSEQDDIIRAMSLRKPYLIAERLRKNDYAAQYLVSHGLGCEFSFSTSEQVSFLKSLNGKKMEEFSFRYSEAELSFDASEIVRVIAEAVK